MSAPTASLGDRLDDLLHHLLLDDLPGPIAVGVVALDADGADLAVRPLDGSDPVDELAGWRAPPHWLAFGLIAPGTTREDPPRAVRFGLLVARDGTEVAAVRADTGAISAMTPARGRVPEACRRVLAPTPGGDCTSGGSGDHYQGPRWPVDPNPPVRARDAPRGPAPGPGRWPGEP